MDPGQGLIYAPLLAAKLEILAPSWAIFNVLTHLIFILTSKKIVVLDQT
jgi:hypothetical protein